MKIAPTRAAWICLVLLLVAVAAGALYALRSLEDTRDSIERNAGVGDEAGVAVSEMRAGVAGIGRGTVDYARTKDPKDREVVAGSRKDFEGASSRYEDLVDDEGDIRPLYDEYEAVGESLMKRSEEQEAARGRIEGDLASVKRILGDETRETVGNREPGSPEKLEETAKMSGAVAGVESAFEDYLADPTPEHSKAISASARNFRLALGRFEKLRLDEGERGRADDLKARFDGAISGVQDALSAGRAVRADERRFASLRTDLNEALDRESRELRSEQEARSQGSTSQALGRARVLFVAVLAAVAAVLAAVVLLATGVAARVGRGGSRLARRAGRTAGRLRRGDVRVEKKLLPLGISLAALLWLAQSVAEAYPFGWGELPGVLLPSRPAEWLGRGAVAAALVGALVYLQYALNRRRAQEGGATREGGEKGEREEGARSLLAAVVESSDDAIIGRTLDGIVTSWNSGARRLYGYEAREVVGGYGFELAPPERLNEMLDLLEKLRRGESVKTYETVHLDKGGRRIDVALTISEILGSAGDPIGYSTIARDITEHRRSQESLQQQKDLYEALLYAQSEVGEGLLILEDGRIVYTNEAFSGISGYGPDELKSLPSVLDLVVPEEKEAFGKRLEERADGRAEGDQETVIQHRSGRRVTVETGIKTIQDNGSPRLIVILRDITERKRAEEALQDSEEKYRMLVETVQEGFGIIDARAEITYCNAAYAAIFDATPGELMGRSLLDFVDEEGQKDFLLKTASGSPGGSSYEVTIRTESGETKDLSASATPVVDVQGRPQGAVHAVIDVTERKRAEERMAYMARYDHLTGLGNRVLFGDRITRALARADRNEEPVALMFLDLDRFKAVNDTLGHEAGDELLKGTARRLGTCVRETDTLARMGGDEFAVILEGLPDGQSAAIVAQKIVDALAEPFDLDGHEVFVTTSIGIAVSPPSSDGDLIRDADAAMYHAKGLGRNTYQFYTPEMNARAHERLSLESSLRGALEREEFVLHYQPQVDLATGKIVGAEALLRWQQPYSGLVQPDKFIDVLEESGLIVPVGDWVLRAACAQGKAWEKEGLPPLRVAVNLSTRQFKGEDLFGRLSRILADTGMEPSLLELELTESILMEDAPVSSAMLDEIRVRLGLNLSIDDFGTGYSSLSYLKRFPLDALKVDRSFVRDIATDPNDAAIVTSIINLAHNLRLKVIAEGVETEEQLSYLRERGCDIVQGFYFSEPVPAAEFSELVRKDEPLPNFSLRG